MQIHQASSIRTLIPLLACCCLGLAPASVDAQLRFNEPRPLAPGVLKVIPTVPDVRDSFSMPMPLPGINAQPYQPKTLPRQVTLHERARRVVLFRDVWQYEFSFTGLRQTSVDVRLPSGAVDKQNIWYMVYRIRNLGKTLNFDQVKANPNFDSRLFELQKDKALAEAKPEFLPRFSLEGWVIPADKPDYERVAYRDVVSPRLADQIQRQEDAGRRLLDTVEMSEAEIPKIKDSSDDGVWGVAVWTNIDPRLDYVSVYVSGLTNAFRIEVSPETADLSFRKKTLQLNFWRPGDTVSEAEDAVSYGIPLVDDDRRQVLITKRYALPGPLVRAYHISNLANRNVLIAEVDAQVDLETFKSDLIPVMDAGKMPPELAAAIKASGLDVPGDLAVKTLIPRQKWSMTIDGESYLLVVEPQYWEPDFGGIRFIKSLDHLWIYR